MQVRSLPMTSGLETEWDYSGRKGRDEQKEKIVKANEKRNKMLSYRREIALQGAL